ncbi:MAG: hypothetical protein WDM87_05455 [Terracidiphilus sp.]
MRRDAQSSALYVGTIGTNEIGVYNSPIITPTVTLTPVTQNPTTIEPLVMMVTVSGGAGNPIPSGGINVSDMSADVLGTLAGGTATVTLPAGSFAKRHEYPHRGLHPRPERELFLR